MTERVFNGDGCGTIIKIDQTCKHVELAEVTDTSGAWKEPTFVEHEGGCSVYIDFDELPDFITELQRIYATDQRRFLR